MGAAPMQRLNWKRLLLPLLLPSAWSQTDVDELPFRPGELPPRRVTEREGLVMALRLATYGGGVTIFRGTLVEEAWMQQGYLFGVMITNGSYHSGESLFGVPDDHKPPHMAAGHLSSSLGFHLRLSA